MFYFIHVQGQNALTTLLHLADEKTTNIIMRVAHDSLFWQILVFVSSSGS